jgi:hypothetical protein
VVIFEINRVTEILSGGGIRYRFGSFSTSIDFSNVRVFSISQLLVCQTAMI